MPIVKTFKQLREIDNAIAVLYGQNEGLKDTKFGYAYKRFSELNYIPVAKEYNLELEQARIENALEDPNTKAILLEPATIRGYKYSKEGLKKVTLDESKIEKEWEKRECTVTPFISTFIPENLSDEVKDILSGTLISFKAE